MFDEYHSFGDKLIMLSVIVLSIAILVFIASGVGAIFTLMFGVFSTKTVLLFSGGTAIVSWLLAHVLVAIEYK